MGVTEKIDNDSIVQNDEKKSVCPNRRLNCDYDISYCDKYNEICHNEADCNHKNE